MPSPNPFLTHLPHPIIDGFNALAYSRTAVRLDFRDYWNGRHAESVEAYRGDRNRVRRSTRELDNAWKALAPWRFNPDGLQRLAAALVEVSGGERFHFNKSLNKWAYITGQYTPTEIRFQAARVLTYAYTRLTREAAAA